MAEPGEPKSSPQAIWRVAFTQWRSREEAKGGAASQAGVDERALQLAEDLGASKASIAYSSDEPAGVVREDVTAEAARSTWEPVTVRGKVFYRFTPQDVKPTGHQLLYSEQALNALAQATAAETPPRGSPSDPVIEIDGSDEAASPARGAHSTFDPSHPSPEADPEIAIALSRDVIQALNAEIAQNLAHMEQRLAKLEADADE